MGNRGRWLLVGQRPSLGWDMAKRWAIWLVHWPGQFCAIHHAHIMRVLLLLAANPLHIHLHEVILRTNSPLTSPCTPNMWAEVGLHGSPWVYMCPSLAQGHTAFIGAHSRIANFQPTHASLKTASPQRWSPIGWGRGSRVPRDRTLEPCYWLGGIQNENLDWDQGRDRHTLAAVGQPSFAHRGTKWLVSRQ